MPARKRARTQMKWRSRAISMLPGRRTGRRAGATAQIYKQALSPMVHNFSRVTNVDMAVYQTEVENRRAQVFRLDSTPGYQDFQSLFDMYKINKVELTFIYCHNSGAAWENGAATPPQWSLPVLYVTEDQDDGNAVNASMFQIQQFKRCVFGRLDKPIKYTVYPKAATALYNGVIATGYGMAKNQWVDCDNAGVEHYGMKFTINPAAPGSDVTILGKLQIICKYFFSFRAAR